MRRTLAVLAASVLMIFGLIPGAAIADEPPPPPTTPAACQEYIDQLNDAKATISRMSAHMSGMEFVIETYRQGNAQLLLQRAHKNKVIAWQQKKLDWQAAYIKYLRSR